MLACDMCVASEKAQFGVPEVKRSLVPAAGGMFRIPRKIPPAIAIELCLTGDPMDCHKAAAHGLVNHITPPGGALEGALKLAERIAVNAPLAVRECLACIKEIGASTPDDEAFRRSNAGFKALSKTEDFKEGPKAFIEKRPPRWTGKKPPGWDSRL